MEQYMNTDKMLRNLCEERFELRYPAKSMSVETITKAKMRMEQELAKIQELGLADYILKVVDYVDWSKNQGLLIGPGRGYSASMIVCYILGITEMDPLVFGLSYERALCSHSSKYFEIDVDMPTQDGEKARAYIHQRFGKNFAQGESYDLEKEERLSRILDYEGVFELMTPYAEKIPLDDSKTMELFCNGDTEGVFPFDSTSESMGNALKDLKPKTFSDLVLLFAMCRPGIQEKLRKVTMAKNEGHQLHFFNRDLERVYSETYGLLVYQEQVNEILQILAGYSYEEADFIRRELAKQKPDARERYSREITERALARGYDAEVVQHVLNDLMEEACYAFLKAHAVSYAYIGYRIAYSKAHCAND